MDRTQQEADARPDPEKDERDIGMDPNDASSPELEKEAIEDSHRDNDDASSVSSVFTEAEMEGPTRESRRGSRRGSSLSGLSRTQSQRLERAQTTASTVLSAVRSRRPRGEFTHPLTNVKTTADVIVDFDGKDDPYRSVNWPFKKKAVTTALYGFTAMATTFASSIYSPAVGEISQEFHVGQEVSTLGISLLLVGMGIGPLIWAPLSEVYGRKMVVLIPFFIFGCFTFGGGAAKDLQTLMICRFFSGLFGSAPVTNTGGVLGDIWTPDKRGAAMVGYAMAVVGGPTLGPIVGGALIVSGMGWRWTQYITGILIMLMVCLDVLILDESYPPVLLVRKASRLRHESGNWALHAKHEEWDVSLVELGHKYLVRPFQLLGTPICLLMALYASFCYGILYGSLAAFPIEFEQERGWNSLIGSLPFLAMLIGILIGASANWFNQKYYVKKWKQNNFRPVPEARLPPMMAGSIFFTAGLFMFAWSSSPDVFWLVPCIGIVLEGIGFFTIFQAALNYLIDTFQRYAASAVAANTALRSGFAAAFPLFISPMLHNIGINWGVSVFAFISALMIPIPYLFFVYGKRIRARGFWSKESTL